jgi:formate dehydrogenase major subunit
VGKINLVIDGIPVEVEDGCSILDAAKVAGIEIPNLCFMKELGAYGACGVCVVEVESSPKLLRACSAKAVDGMVVYTSSSRALKARKLAMELMMGDHDGDCIGPCRLKCPAHTDCQKYIKEIADGNYPAAVKTIKEIFPFPSSIGRVCPHPCETACRRKNVESAISIARLKAYAGDMVRELKNEIPIEKVPSSGKRVGIVGGGPAGLTAAFQLAKMGHEVTVYDQMPEMGGMLRYGIPAYRLSKEVLKYETDAIRDFGVKFVNDFKLGRDEKFSDFRARFDAVIVATGAWKSSSMRTKGEDISGVIGGIDFLRAVSTSSPMEIGERVVIVGGGNTAMDACRTAVRLGAKEVEVVYRRTRAEMPAEEIEIAEAEEEGVKFRFLTSPEEIIADGENKVCALKLQKMELGAIDSRGRPRPVPIEGAFETVNVDTIIVAVGQKNDNAGLEDLAKTPWDTIEAKLGDFSTSVEGVFACGDNTNRGAGIAIEAIAEANIAAKAVDAYLKGRAYSHEESIVSERTVSEIDFKDVEKRPRLDFRVREASSRRNDFCEISLKMDDGEVRSEAKRCLECGCHDYSDCKLIRYARELRTDVRKFQGEHHAAFVERSLVSIERNQRKCITCNLCVRVCEKVAKRGILGLVGRGFNTVIRPEFRDASAIAGCRDCRKCVESCPTGALKLV